MILPSSSKVNTHTHTHTHTHTRTHTHTHTHTRAIKMAEKTFLHSNVDFYFKFDEYSKLKKIDSPNTHTKNHKSIFCFSVNVLIL